MNKVTEQELKSLRDLNSKISQLKSTIADCEVQIAKAKMIKDECVTQIQVDASALIELQSKLEESYGNIVVNLQTGEYRYDNQEGIDRG